MSSENRISAREVVQQIKDEPGLKSFGSFLLKGMDNGTVDAFFSKGDQDPASGHKPLFHDFRYLIGIETLNGQW